MRACAGTWIAHGSGTADRETVDKHDRVDVPPGEPAYRLRRDLAHARGGGRLLQRLRQRGAVAAVPHRARAADVPLVRLRAVPRGQREVRRRGRRGGAHRRDPIVLVQDYHFALLPRMIRERLPQRDGRHVLAHPVAEPRGVLDLPVARRAARRHARQQHPRLPHAVPLQQLPRHRRSRARGARRPRDLRGHLRAATSPRCSATRSRSRGRRSRSRASGASAHARAAVRERLGVGADVRARRRHRPARLHEGHPRALPRGRAPARARIREWVGTFTFVQIAAPTRGMIADYRDYATRREGARRRDQRALRVVRRAPPIRLHRRAPRGRRRSTSTTAPPTCASCRACTTA